MSGRDYGEALSAEIEKHGGKVVNIEIGRKHKKLHYEFHGRERFYVYPSSPSDSRRGLENSLASLRRELGVKKQVHKNGRKRARNRVETVEPPEHITPGPPGMEAIYQYMPQPRLSFWKRMLDALRARGG